jgi:hypothetical protein
MHRKQARLRNLAMQLVVQLQTVCHDEAEAQEVRRLMGDLIGWQYAEGEPSAGPLGRRQQVLNAGAQVRGQIVHLP